MATGMDKKAAKTTYTKVEGYITSLDNHLNSLNAHIAEMNKSVWYGGKRAASWYKSANETCYINDVAFRDGVVLLQTELKQYVGGIDASINF